MSGNAGPRTNNAAPPKRQGSPPVPAVANKTNHASPQANGMPSSYASEQPESKPPTVPSHHVNKPKRSKP